MAMESVVTMIAGGAFISLTAFKAFLTASNSILVLLVNTWCAPAPCWISSPLLKMAKPHPALLVAGSSDYKDRVSTTVDVRKKLGENRLGCSGRPDLANPIEVDDDSGLFIMQLWWDAR